MLLSDYIDQHHNGIRADFARSQGVAPQQVNKWLAGQWIVINERLYSPKQELKTMNILFDTLDGIFQQDDYIEENLSSPDNVVNYADACGYSISEKQAEKIIEVGKKWLHEIENGNGEWSRMRYEAKAELDAFEAAS